MKSYGVPRLCKEYLCIIKIVKYYEMLQNITLLKLAAGQEF